MFGKGIEVSFHPRYVVEAPAEIDPACLCGPTLRHKRFKRPLAQVGGISHAAIG